MVPIFLREKWSSISNDAYLRMRQRAGQISGQKAVESKLRTLLAEIEREYDMRHFDLTEFGDWVAARDGRRLESVAMPLSSAIFGCWFSTEDVHYIFYDSQVHPVHQAHIRLHELSHILCGHQTGHLGEGTQDDLTSAFAHAIEYFGQDGQESAEIRSALLRSTASSQEELEAELLPDMIMEAIVRWRLRDELAQPISFSNLVVDTYEAMGWA